MFPNFLNYLHVSILLFPQIINKLLGFNMTYLQFPRAKRIYVVDTWFVIALFYFKLGRKVSFYRCFTLFFKTQG
jgi:hypothetical protein